MVVLLPDNFAGRVVAGTLLALASRVFEHHGTRSTHRESCLRRRNLMLRMRIATALTGNSAGDYYNRSATKILDLFDRLDEVVRLI